MKKINIVHINEGLLNESAQIAYFKEWNNSILELSYDKIKVIKKDILVYEALIEIIEEDIICITYKAALKSGEEFRIIIPGKTSSLIQKLKQEAEEISIGSVNPQGFGIYFKLYDDINEVSELNYTTSSKQDSLDRAASRIIHLIQNKEFNKALQTANNIINNNPEISTIYYLRGIAHNYLENWLKARNDFNTVIDYLPKELQIECYSCRALSNINLGNFEGAIFDSNQILRSNPNSDEAYVKRGWSFMSLGKMDNALDDFLKALEINPENTNALENIQTILNTPYPYK